MQYIIKLVGQRGDILKKLGDFEAFKANTDEEAQKYFEAKTQQITENYMQYESLICELHKNGQTLVSVTTKRKRKIYSYD